jgi:hypothetical protein
MPATSRPTPLKRFPTNDFLILPNWPPGANRERDPNWARVGLEPPPAIEEPIAERQLM